MTRSAIHSLYWLIGGTLWIVWVLGWLGPAAESHWEFTAQDAAAINSAADDLKFVEAQEKREAAEREQFPNGQRVKRK